MRSQRQFGFRPTLPTLNDGLSSSQQLDAIGGIARAAQPGGVRPELVEPLHQPVVAIAALVSRSASASSSAIQSSTFDLRDLGRWRDPVEEVPVVGERLGDRAQVRELDADREPEHDHLLEPAVVEHLVDEPLPARVERDRGRDLVAGPRCAAAVRPRSGTR